MVAMDLLNAREYGVDDGWGEAHRRFVQHQQFRSGPLLDTGAWLCGATSSGFQSDHVASA
jgi:hypothetical protein